MSERDSHKPKDFSSNAFRRGIARWGLVGGFVVISGFIIAPTSAVSAPAPIERSAEPKPTETPVPKNTATRVPTPDYRATLEHERRVRDSIFSSELNQVKIAVTQHAADIGTLTAKDREIVVDKQTDGAFLNFLKIGTVGIAVAAFGYGAWRLYRRGRRRGAAGGGHVAAPH